MLLSCGFVCVVVVVGCVSGNAAFLPRNVSSKVSNVYISVIKGAASDGLDPGAEDGEGV